jgi:hypothetical protein
MAFFSGSLAEVVRRTRTMKTRAGSRLGPYIRKGKINMVMHRILATLKDIEGKRNSFKNLGLTMDFVDDWKDELIEIAADYLDITDPEDRDTLLEVFTSFTKGDINEKEVFEKIVALFFLYRVEGLEQLPRMN